MSEPIPLVSEMLEAVQADLQGFAGQLKSDPALYQIVEHHFGWAEAAASGKGVRPLLCLLCCAAAGGEWRAALPAATAVELIHNFSLIHDDIQDRSEFRRHRRTVWKVWGEALAINAGDALFSLARLSTQRLGLPPPRLLAVHLILDEACLELTRGQQRDLGFSSNGEGTLARYLRMIEAKTASLLAASAAAGSMVAGAPASRQAAFQAFGRELGLAFQILDDVLGLWGAPGQTGKSVGQDLLERKPSFPALHALEHEPSFAALWEDSTSELTSLLGALDAAGSREAATLTAGEYTSACLTSLAAAKPDEPAAAALRSLANGLLHRHS
ncbi:MAG: polyprenyl synthetase family protein [Anaerolineales bacterium]